MNSVAPSLRTARSASGGGEAVEEDKPLHVVDHVGYADLHPGAGDADGADEEVHLSFCSANTCSTPERTLDLSALAGRVVSGIGRPGGFLRWMRLTKLFFSKNSSFAFER